MLGASHRTFMKSPSLFARCATIKFTMGLVALLTGGGGALAAIPPAGVAVTYALVPKERLAEAVRGARAALKIEDEWRQAMIAKPGYPIDLAHEKYSIVVFVANPTGGAIWGQVGLPIQSPRHPVVLNVSLAPGYDGTYVIDGGGLILPRIPPEPKPYAWLEIHSE